MAFRLLPSVLSRHAARSLLANSAIKPTGCFFSSTPALSTTTSDLVVNALGADRPGIVSEMTKLVTDAGGSVGDSQATKLGADFSLTMLIHVPSDKSEQLQSSLQNMEGMSTNCIPATSPASASSTVAASKQGFTGRFRLEGADNPGLVHKVTSVLAKHGLSIDQMHTSEESAPYGGTTLFFVDGVVNLAPPLPKSFDAQEIAKELDELGDAINCNVSLEDQSGKKKRPNWIWENLA